MSLTPDELERIAAAPPVERDVGLTAGRRVYLMEWERDALVAEVRRLRAENRHLMFNQRWMYKSLGLGLPPGTNR